MKYANVFYVPHFNIIGGIETYCYELAKKYHDKDITFVYSNSTSDMEQLNRIRKYARVIYQDFNSKDPIKCERLYDEGKCDRHPISWEVYQVLNGHNVNDFIISETSYLAISDETIDIDAPWQIEQLENKLK